MSPGIASCHHALPGVIWYRLASPRIALHCLVLPCIASTASHCRDDHMSKRVVSHRFHRLVLPRLVSAAALPCLDGIAAHCRALPCISSYAMVSPCSSGVALHHVALPCIAS